MRHYIRLIVQYLLVCDDWIQCTFMTYGDETHNKYEIILPIYYITSNFIFIEYAGQSRRETVHLISFNSDSFRLSTIQNIQFNHT